jgi:hypothetical protein
MRLDEETSFLNKREQPVSQSQNAINSPQELNDWLGLSPQAGLPMTRTATILTGSFNRSVND